MPPLPPIEGHSAFFFDFDGTLAEIAAHPDAVQVDAGVPPLLLALFERCGGAVAIITGRPVQEIDHHLDPVRLPTAGVHGAERRRGDGLWQRLDAPELGAPREALQRWCAGHEGLHLEIKPGAMALHYRAAPALEAQALAAMQQALEQLPGMVLLRGKMVVELKPAAADKGLALQAFMREAPFAGRRPWFFGDDVTDEAALAAVQAMGGVAVKIGPGDTVAGWRMADPAALRVWLRSVVDAGVVA